MTDRPPHDRLAERRRLVASLPSGPRAPIATTPSRRPGSVRRTTAVDQRCAMPGEASVIQASGRDLATGLDGTATVLDEATLVIGLDPTGSVSSVATDPAVPALDALVGAHARSGFRARAAELAPEQRAGATVLHQLLDDVPLAALIASYGMTREHPEWEIPPAAVERLGDLCAGWAFGATMLSTTLDLGIFPVPIGPSLPIGAPALGEPDGGGDPLGWHELGEIPTQWVRRVRRLDAWPDPDDAGLVQVEAYFRDSYRPPSDRPPGDRPPGERPTEGARPEALHEYTLTATADRATRAILSAQATAHTLPWPECPGALASADRTVGMTVDEIADRVRADFTGTSTCSHLNDQLRSLAGLAALLPALPDDEEGS